MFSKTHMIDAADALPGSAEPMPVPDKHAVLGTELQGFPEGIEIAVFAMGCFWGAEKEFWLTPGVFSTAVGYAGGHTPNPTYEEVCTGRTGHAEVVLVAFAPNEVPYGKLLKVFWEKHDPTQGMRQGNDRGTQYRSAIFTTTDRQLEEAKLSRDLFQQQLDAAGMGTITTDISSLGPFFYAEGYHQQYLEKNPMGYCPDHSCGVTYPSES